MKKQFIVIASIKRCKLKIRKNILPYQFKTTDYVGDAKKGEILGVSISDILVYHQKKGKPIYSIKYTDGQDDFIINMNSAWLISLELAGFLYKPSNLALMDVARYARENGGKK